MALSGAYSLFLWIWMGVSFIVQQRHTLTKIFFQVLAPNVSSWAPARLHAFSCNCTLVCRMHFMSCSLILWSSALLPFRPQCTWVTIVTKEAVWDFTLYRGYHFLILGADSQHMFLHVLFCGALLFWRLLLKDKKKWLAHIIWFCVLTSAPCPQLISWSCC